MFCAVTLLALLATVQGRAVNISNTWVLPEEGFPVFYRHFRDRISWYEADAVCQFHHANLVTVDTTAQYDAVRAYLKELDITSAVWVGLIRSNPDGDFTWTDYRGMSGDGYWSSAPDGRTAPLCAAANPAADYRWDAQGCGGPIVASFICELPVPQWALGNEGCMIRALPALTILYLPESAAVQLTTDCGLAGVKRVECTGNVKREELLRDLSCTEEDDTSSTLTFISITTSPVTTDALYTDEDTTKEITTEDNITTEHEDDINQSINMTNNLIPQEHKSTGELLIKISNPNKVILSKSINLDVVHNNNLQSNYIPKIANTDTVLTIEQYEKLENEKLMEHKMLHEEIARMGNLDNIFTQPTDHFVPPLVMAKAKISDDMTVLSLAEKHAQQIAERHFPKPGFINTQSYPSSTENYKIYSSSETPLITPITLDKPIYIQNKDKAKSNAPKKYSEKYDAKTKIFKTEYKFIDTQSTMTAHKPTISTPKEFDTTIINPTHQEMFSNINEDDPVIDLTILIKDTPSSNGKEQILTNYSGDISKLENIQNDRLLINKTLYDSPKIVNTTSFVLNTDQTVNKNKDDITSSHEIIKITMIDDINKSSPPVTFDVTTKIPIYENLNISNITLESTNILLDSSADTDNNSTKDGISIPKAEKNYNDIFNSTSEINILKSNISVSKYANYNDVHKSINENVMFIIDTTIAPTSAQVLNITEMNYDQNKVTLTNVPNMHNKTNVFFTTESQENLETNTNGTLEIDDFESPLLSAASEPLHRPNRSRRPQQPQNHNKFNPFRILG